MIQTKWLFKFHKTLIIVICLGLVALLMQSVTYISNSHYQAKMAQFTKLTRQFAEQVAFSLSDYIIEGSKDFNRERIVANLNQMATDERILDVGIYLSNGTLVASAGEKNSVRERLLLDNANKQPPFREQLVVSIPNDDNPKGYLRITIDTQPSSTEVQQANGSINLLRMLLLLAVVIGFVIANTLFRLKQKKGQALPYPLTPDGEVTEDDINSDESQKWLQQPYNQVTKTKPHHAKNRHRPRARSKKPNK